MKRNRTARMARAIAVWSPSIAVFCFAIGIGYGAIEVGRFLFSLALGAALGIWSAMKTEQ